MSDTTPPVVSEVCLPEPSTVVRRRVSPRLVRQGLSTAALVAGGVLVARLPAHLSMSWTEIAAVLRGVSLTWVVSLTALWLVGLVVHTIVLTAALPGLSMRRALLLNLSGSAVSNLIPFGGAAGVGIGYVMARQWQVAPVRFASFTAISNAWNLLGKVLVSCVLLTVLVMFGVQLPRGLGALAVTGALVLALVLAALAVLLTGRGRAVRLGRRLDAVHDWVAGRLGSDRRSGFATSVLRFGTTTREVVVAGWGRLTLGVVAYLCLQALLMALCFAAVGADVPWTIVLAAFAIERLLSLVPLTPGGVGFAEIGTAGVLVALGIDPLGAAAGILLFRLFTFALEIPVGGATALAWLHLNRHELDAVRTARDSAIAPGSRTAEVAA